MPGWLGESPDWPKLKRRLQTKDVLSWGFDYKAGGMEVDVEDTDAPAAKAHTVLEVEDTGGMCFMC